MFVKKFMHPWDKVGTMEPEDLIGDLLDKMVDENYRALVVVNKDSPRVPLGIVTKADVIRAYKVGLNPKVHRVKEIMSTTIESVLDSISRDVAAKHFETTKHENAFVLDKNGTWVGMLSSIDIAVECARDDHAWPWNRDALADKYKVPTSPKSASPKSVRKGVPAHTFEAISGANAL